MREIQVDYRDRLTTERHVDYIDRLTTERQVEVETGAVGDP